MFKSFFLGGFEGSVGHNQHRNWFDAVSMTRHDHFLEEDYARLVKNEIHAVRECVRWPLVDKGHSFDFSTLNALMRAGRKAGITTIYDLFHFGYPPSLDILSEEFPKRFAEYCYQIAKRVCSETDGVCYFTPVNEPSYFSWASGEVGLFAPHLLNRGNEVKIAVVRAAIQGINAIWAASPQARIVSVDPFCRVVPSMETEEESRRADIFNSQTVFQSWDMLAGIVMPELGGSLRHLDIVGINYYTTNQWTLDASYAPLADNDPRRMPLWRIAWTVWKRYGREIIFTETSHVGEKRPDWIRNLVTEVELMRSMKIPIQGICWYPVLEMAEWHTPEIWIPMGLWDLEHQSGSMKRIAYKPVLRALREAQARLDLCNEAVVV